MDDRILVADLERLAATGVAGARVDEVLDLIQEWELGLWDRSHRSLAQNLLTADGIRAPSVRPQATRQTLRGGRRIALEILSEMARGQRRSSTGAIRALVSEVLNRRELPAFLESSVLDALSSHPTAFANLRPDVQDWIRSKRPEYDWSKPRQRSELSGEHLIRDRGATQRDESSRHVSASALADASEDPLRNLCRMIKQTHGVAWHDKRTKGGNLLVEYLKCDDDTASQLRSVGFRFIAGRGWWRK